MATNCIEYEHSKVEPHWQAFWEKEKTFHADSSLDKPKFYALDMFPYPSGAGLHIGHPEGYTASDIICRYKLANGFNVLHPMGWDAFGLPAEQYAIKTGTHPKETTYENIDNFRRQIKAFGFTIDWDREINTTDPNYYRWTQWIFLQLFKKGLAYVDERPVWWCPELKTILANEEIVDGKSERGEHPVERRNLRQWVLKITAYADRLLDGLDDLDWPNSTKTQQKNWIGKSEGAEVTFDIDGFPNEKMEIFTTRPDTLFGVTYMVLAPEHPLVKKITKYANQKLVAAYIKQAAGKSDMDRTELAKDKTGVFTGAYAINPVNNKKIPIWIADYVLISYGTGAIMAVPAHDERDFEFAQKYNLQIQPVIEKKQSDENGSATKLPFSGVGVMIHSNEYTGLDSDVGRKKITEELEKTGRGKSAVNFKLRDWLFSRQRYWGEPFPIVWVNKEDYLKVNDSKTSKLKNLLPESPVCYRNDGNEFYALPLPEEHLPLVLPEVESYLPTGFGESPLATEKNWVEIYLNLETGETVSASTEKPVKENWIRANRETNTMPQWAGSCWYYLRYCDPGNSEKLIDPEVEKYWGMPDFYIGGAEHAVLHLLYARFWHQVLFDLKIVSHPEPFKKLFHQGIILGEDGVKMSKSRGNVINPDDVIAEYGADSLRLYEMFMGPLEDMKPWTTTGIEGVYRFLKKVWREIIDSEGKINEKIICVENEKPDTEKLLHESIKKVTEDFENLRFNTSISQLMIFANHLQKVDTVTIGTIKIFVQLLNPLAPHISEELWERLGEKSSISFAEWPTFDPKKLVSDEVKIIFQINGKYRGDAILAKNIDQDSALDAARNIERIAKHFEDKIIKKIIFVPNKILNIVTG